MSDAKDVFRVQNYYPQFAHCSLPATFAFLREPEITDESIAEYAGMSNEERTGIKDVGGTQRGVRHPPDFRGDASVPRQTFRFDRFRRADRFPAFSFIQARRRRFGAERVVFACGQRKNPCSCRCGRRPVRLYPQVPRI